MNLKTIVASQIRKYPRIAELIKNAAYKVSPESVVLLDYPVHSRRRWDEENPHKILHEIINRNRASYRADLHHFLHYMDYYLKIPGQYTDNTAPTQPCWINGWMPAMDGVALYGYLAKNNPELYLEVGSGNSTKFARKAINDHNLKTKIISIDPCPRVEVNDICDEVIRKPVEDVDIKLFDRLGADDILYIDNSHRALMNSDATILFLDVIPRLRPGVNVEIHDITLPYDYPADWTDRFYSEQYLLAAFLLGQGRLFDIILPCMFISHDNELKGILNPLWQKDEMKNVERHGCSFWLRMN